MQRPLPTGTVTFLFTDIEASTRLLADLGEVDYARALADHRRVLRAALARHSGVEVDTQGDALFAAFPTAAGALAAAEEAQAALGEGPIRVRIGIHTGAPLVADGAYVGPDVHRAARIAAAGRGGQVLVSASTAALVEAAGLTDLGEHRLKDLSAPERLYQLGRRQFLPPRSLYQTNLPLPPTPFLGRHEELAAVGALLAREEVRLVTLTGPGGTGKTRLAVQAAAEVAERYPDGTWWVPLAPLRDPALVLETAAHVLGAAAGLAEHIGDRKLLLLFDNFEHVGLAATDVGALLAACPRLAVLATSRERLHLAAEREYPVPPLRPAEGVALFIDRARAVRPDFSPDAAVASICARLDDLPLAIELAAAHVKVLAPAALLARLEQRLPLLSGGARDLPERQRTLRATIEWSYDLLADGERGLFARLSVFRGGWTLEAAEDVASAALADVEGLVDKSLVRMRGERYVMLETIREFASEKLTASAENDAVRRRHADHFLALAEEAEGHLWQFSPQWLDRLSSDHDNLRAALDHLEQAADVQAALHIGGALQRFWIVRGHLAEGERRLAALLRADRRPTGPRAKALNGAALIAINTGNQVGARAMAEEALAIHAAIGDAWGEARSRYIVGHALAEEGDFATARRLFEGAREAFDGLGDEHNVLHVTANLAWACEQLGDRQAARTLNEDNLARARQLGNRSMEGLSLGGLANDALEAGRPDEALGMWREALRIDRELRDLRRSVDDLCRYAHGLARAGETTTAGRLLCAAEALHREIGASVSPDLAAVNDQTRRLIGERLPSEAADRACGEGRRMSFEQAIALALGEASAD